jgi:hypothetical protein
MKSLLAPFKDPKRLGWILLQGAFLPLVVFSSNGLPETPIQWSLLGLYEVLVYVDAILTCKLFEPKDKAK